MARPQLKISRSMVARLIAIAILIAMGAFAVLQSRKSPTPDEVASNSETSESGAVSETEGASLTTSTLGSEGDDSNLAEPTTMGSRQAVIPPSGASSATPSASSGSLPSSASGSGLPASNSFRPDGLSSNNAPATSSSGSPTTQPPSNSLAGGTSGGFNPGGSAGVDSGTTPTSPGLPPSAPSLGGGGGFRASGSGSFPAGPAAPAATDGARVPAATFSVSATPAGLSGNAPASLPEGDATNGPSNSPAIPPSTTSLPPASFSPGNERPGNAAPSSSSPAGLSAALSSVVNEPSTAAPPTSTQSSPSATVPSTSQSTPPSLPTSAPGSFRSSLPATESASPMTTSGSGSDPLDAGDSQTQVRIPTTDDLETQAPPTAPTLAPEVAGSPGALSPSGASPAPVAPPTSLPRTFLPGGTSTSSGPVSSPPSSTPPSTLPSSGSSSFRTAADGSSSGSVTNPTPVSAYDTPDLSNTTPRPASAAGLPPSGMPPSGLSSGALNSTPAGPEPAVAVPSESLPRSTPTTSLAPSGLPRSSSQTGASGLSERNAFENRNAASPATPEASGPTRAFPASAESESNIAIGRSVPDRSSPSPGSNELEGEQAPALIIEKLAPQQAQVGQPATFELIVKNIGNSTAYDVLVTDRIPAGARVERTEPQAETRGSDRLIWQIGDLRPGAESRIRIVLVPERTGEIGSVAQVTFLAAASGRIIVTQPRLTMRLVAVESVRVGESFDVQIRITNEGDGEARDVILETDVAPELAHAAGREIRYEVGTLAPGEATVVTLSLAAESAGAVSQRLIAHGPTVEAAEQLLQIDVVSPSMSLEVVGPSLRFLDRKAIHRLTIANQGSASARDVELVATLPRGLRFVEADQQGTYDPRTHAVYWSLVELPAGQSGTVRLETVPVETGEFSLDFSVSADQIGPVVDRQAMSVRQLAELVFEVEDEVDQVEIGSETVYVIRVENQGTKDSKQVALRVLFPAGIEPTDDIRSPLRFQRRGNEVLFETLDQLAPNESFQIEISAIGRQAGDQRVAVEVRSEDRPDWVRKEESTHVYADR